MPDLGYTAVFAKELEPLRRPIHSVNRHPDNPRTHDIPAIQNSLNANGQLKPIVVQASTMFVVAGNGTHEAAEGLGWEEIAMVVEEMTDAKALAYLYADNRTSDQARYDQKKLVAGLEKLALGPGLWETGYTMDDLEDLMASGVVEPTVAPEFLGAFAETPEDQARREAASKVAVEGQKRREVPIVLTLADHALFVGYIKTLQKIYDTKSVALTVFVALRRQAEAELGTTDVVRVGEPLTTNTVSHERREALKGFRDLIVTMGAQKEYRGSWLLGQLEAAMNDLVPRPTEPVAEAESVHEDLSSTEPVAEVNAADAQLDATEEALIEAAPIVTQAVAVVSETVPDDAEVAEAFLAAPPPRPATPTPIEALVPDAVLRVAPDPSEVVAQADPFDGADPFAGMELWEPPSAEPTDG